jgi:hypothetical protein
MSPRLLLALTTIALGFAAIAALLMPNPGTRTSTPAAVSEAAHEAHAGGTAVSTTLDDTRLAAALAPATEIPADRAAELSLAADRICEGLTAEVPVTTIEQTLVAQESLTADEAHRLVEVAATVRCSPTV